jgi:Fanconi anemia group M protein
VGPVTARKLLEAFDSVKGVFNASIDDLKRVSGVGDKTARNIRKIIESKYSDTFRFPSDSEDTRETSIITGKNKPKMEYKLEKED